MQFAMKCHGQPMAHQDILLESVADVELFQKVTEHFATAVMPKVCGVNRQSQRGVAGFGSGAGGVSAPPVFCSQAEDSYS